MIDFIRILLFAKTLLLTPEPIDLFGDVELRPLKPLTAITAGADIEIDVSSMFTKPKEEDVVDFRRRLAETFPTGTIEAKLFGEGGQVEILSFDGNSAFSDHAVILLLGAKNGVPTDVKFERVLITSRVKLHSVNVSWKNYKE